MADKPIVQFTSEVRLISLSLLRRFINYKLKAAKILIAEDGTLKISDFGAIHTLRTVELEFRIIAGVPNWMAPEVILLKGASDKSDIYTGIPAGIPRACFFGHQLFSNSRGALLCSPLSYR